VWEAISCICIAGKINMHIAEKKKDFHPSDALFSETTKRMDVVRKNKQASRQSTIPERNAPDLSN
jgi:hypothetical protein